MKKSEITIIKRTYIMNGLELRDIVRKHFMNRRTIPENVFLKINGKEMDGRDFVTFMMEIVSSETEAEDV